MSTNNSGKNTYKFTDDIAMKNIGIQDNASIKDHILIVSFIHITSLNMNISIL
jgi:hypothetical protein